MTAGKTVVETKRLTLRELTHADVDVLAAIYADETVMYMKGGARPRPYAEHVIAEAIECYATRGYYFWAVIHKTENKLIGLCGLLDQRVDGCDEVEVAYMLAKAYWNQGLATEAARAARDYGFRLLPTPHLISLIAHENIASQKVALKNDMRYERDCIDQRGRARRVYKVTRSSDEPQFQNS